jgi:hypothetical protein
LLATGTAIGWLRTLSTIEGKAVDVVTGAIVADVAAEHQRKRSGLRILMVAEAMQLAPAR